MTPRLLAVPFCLLLQLTASHQGHAQSHDASCAAQSGPLHTVSASLLHTPVKAWQHFEKARNAVENNQLNLFDREYAQALAADPQFAEVYLLRASLQVRQGQYQGALQTVETARAIQPNLPWASIVVAGALTQLGRYDQALAELDRARTEEADSWQFSFERARAELGRRHPAAALRWSQLAVTAAPVGCTDARLVLANAYQLAGQTPMAITQLETYLAEDKQGTRRSQVQAALEHTRQTALQQVAAARQADPGQTHPQPAGQDVAVNHHPAP